MARPRILVLSLGGTITMLPGEAGGIAPRLGAEDLVAALADRPDSWPVDLGTAEESSVPL